MTETRWIFIKELTPRCSLPVEVDEDLQDELAAQGFFNRDVFSFVGIYYSILRAAIVVGVPKYHSLPDSAHEQHVLLKEISFICKVAGRAKLPSSPMLDDQFRSSELRGNTHISNPYELSVFLLQDYTENGLYQDRITKIRKDGIGSHSWSRTLRHTMPFFDQGPLYLHPIAVQQKRAFSSSITPLHAYAINLCAKLLQPFQLFENLELPEGVPPLPANTDLSQYIPVLNEKLTQTFSERDLRLLRALRAWCGQTPYNRTRFGVTSFELLWQYAVNQYFGNVANTRLGAPQYYNYKKVGIDTYDNFSGSGDAIPDTLYVISEPTGQKSLAIFDAKYYVPKWVEGERKVVGAPPNSDIAKQIQYCHSLETIFSDNRILFSNTFLLPDPAASELYQYIGYATESNEQNQEIADRLAYIGLPASRSDFVLLYGVNPLKLWKACLKKETASQEEIFQEFIMRFERKRGRM